MSSSQFKVIQVSEEKQWWLGEGSDPNQQAMSSYVGSEVVVQTI